MSAKSVHWNNSTVSVHCVVHNAVCTVGLLHALLTGIIALRTVLHTMRCARKKASKIAVYLWSPIGVLVVTKWSPSDHQVVAKWSTDYTAHSSTLKWTIGTTVKSGLQCSSWPGCLLQLKAFYHHCHFVRALCMIKVIFCTDNIFRLVFKISWNMCHGRVGKCHGYDGYIRLKILTAWGKSLGKI